MGWGVPTGAGLVDRAVNQGPWLQERVGGGRKGWMVVPVEGEGWLQTGPWGSKGFGAGGVGGRGTGEQISQLAWARRGVQGLWFLVVGARAAYKKRKMMFFEGCPVGWGGYPPELAWWTGR